MSSRGSVAVNGHYMNNEYKTIEILQNGEKIIEGFEIITQCLIIRFQKIPFILL